MEKIISISEFNERNTSGFHITTDKQVITLEIENGQNCCEEWGYFMSHDDFTEFIGAELTDVKIVDEALKVYDGLDMDNTDLYIMFVNIGTANGLLQFVAHNSHNGYYSHTARVCSNQVTASESL